MTLNELLWKHEDIGKALAELQKEQPLHSGFRYDELFVTYSHAFNGQNKSQIPATDVAQAFKVGQDDAKKALDKFVELGLMKDVGDGIYETDIVTRVAVKKLSTDVLSSLLDSSVKSRHLIHNLPDAFAKMREYARTHIYGQPPTPGHQIKS